jgi:Fe-S cluster biogenesis protein NfuA
MPIFDFFRNGPTSAPAAPATQAVKTSTGSSDAEITQQVGPILEELRPFLQQDGGDCELARVEDGIVYVRLVGSCVGCPSSLATLKGGIEMRLKEAIPAIRQVDMVSE